MIAAGFVLLGPLRAESEKVFTDDFSSSAAFEKQWDVSSKHDKCWSIDRGVLVVRQTNPDHGAVVRRQHDFGDLMEAFLDGVSITKLKSPGFAHPTKTKFGMTVNGDSIAYDKLRIRKATDENHPQRP